MKNLIKIKKWK